MDLTIFTINDKEYGVDIGQVRQVIRMKEITPVPDAGNAVEGVISLRGKVIPIINLKKKLGLVDDGIKKWQRIIITDIDGHTLGLVVDKVTDVVKLEPGEISAPDDVLKDAGYLVGVARSDKRLILVSDIGKMLSSEDKDKISGLHGRVEIRKRG